MAIPETTCDNRYSYLHRSAVRRAHPPKPHRSVTPSKRTGDSEHRKAERRHYSLSQSCHVARMHLIRVYLPLTLTTSTGNVQNAHCMPRTRTIRLRVTTYNRIIQHLYRTQDNSKFQSTPQAHIALNFSSNSSVASYTTSRTLQSFSATQLGLTRPLPT